MKYLPIVILLVAFFGLPVISVAQDLLPESGRIFALSTEGGLQLAEKTDFPQPSGTIDIDWNPEDPTRWARVDNFGILRFVDPGSDLRNEGTYTFSPFFNGYQAASPESNKLYIREVEWSPDGEQLAFRIQNENEPDASQGVWFWAPIFELPTDPSYQILGHCPPFCSMFGMPENAAGWRSTSLEWSSDNETLLVGLWLIGEQRRALEIRRAERDVEGQQLDQPIDPLYYDYGHWANDGINLVVSGRDVDNRVVFGTVTRSGEEIALTPASDIGMAWVQDAVQAPDGTLLMLGSPLGAGAALQIVNEQGDLLSPPIGEAAPERVSWSPDRSAVLLRIDGSTFVAQTDGTVYDITSAIDNSPNVDWVPGGLPSSLARVTLPAPLETDFVAESATPEPHLTVGELLTVTQGTLDVYQEPAGDSVVVGTLLPGDELIITSEPLSGTEAIWYRVQTLEFTGWIRNTANLAVPEN